MTLSGGALGERVHLLRGHDLYDRSVDIVSAFEALFTRQAEISATVSHFERYPKIVHPDGRPATPDFTVLFTDGTGIAAEIANIAQHDNSIEKLTQQAGRYDGLISLPGPFPASPRAGEASPAPAASLHD